MSCCDCGLSEAFPDKKVRHAFMRRVYFIVMFQLAITAGIICLFLYIPKAKYLSMHHPEIFGVAFVLNFILMIVLICCDTLRRSFPANYICLFIFTLSFSLLLGSAASHFNTDSVLIAVGLSSFMCFGLTLFALQTKIDFTTCSGFLMGSLFTLAVFGILAFILPPEKILVLVFACLGAIIFCLYVVSDIQLMVGGKHKYSLSQEEYIYAALSIYLDVLNIFLYIFKIVRSCE